MYQSPNQPRFTPPHIKGTLWRRYRWSLVCLLLAIVFVCVVLSLVAVSTPQPQAQQRAVTTIAITHTSNTPTTTAKPTATATTKPTATPVRTGTGVNGNPWGYDFVPGSLIYSPDPDFCSYFTCISNFFNGRGYVEECVDGDYSKSGGISGSCSRHGGNLRPLYSH